MVHESCENIWTPFWVEWVKWMVKNCFAVGCSNVYRKGSGAKVYRFVSDPERKAKLGMRTGHQMSILGWLRWEKQQSWQQSSGYVPSLFEYVDIALLREDWKVVWVNFTEGKLWREDKPWKNLLQFVALWVKVYGIPAASCSSSIQAVDDNEETNSSNGEAQILSEMGITCCQLALSKRQNRMLKSKMRIFRQAVMESFEQTLWKKAAWSTKAHYDKIFDWNNPSDLFQKDGVDKPHCQLTWWVKKVLRFLL